jgi:hypothetical protein
MQKPCFWGLEVRIMLMLSYLDYSVKETLIPHRGQFSQKIKPLSERKFMNSFTSNSIFNRKKRRP